MSKHLDDRAHTQPSSDRASERSITGFSLASTETFNQIKSASKELFLCAYAPLGHVAEFSSPTWGYALFNHTGHLLKLFGHPDFIASCSARGIVPGTCWDEAQIGPNAVSGTLATGIVSASPPSLHEIPALRQCAVYASPLSLDYERVGAAFSSYKLLMSQDTAKSVFQRKGICIFGSVAILNLAFQETQQNREDFFPALAEGVAREICLQLHWFCVSFTDFSEEIGNITLDHSRGEQQITFISSNIYRFFDLSMELSFRLQPLARIIDPEPHNAEFWKIVKHRKVVRRYPITVTGNGKTLEALMTTSRSVEPRFYMVEYVIHFCANHTSQRLQRDSEVNARLATFDNIVCNDPPFKENVNYAKSAAASDSTILLTGESGTGKDLFAQAIHMASPRRGGPFVAVNCAAIPKELIASELFGYAPGAFTGAKKSGAMGKFEMANGGTLFLDEIGDMPLELQGHLLRAIEQKRFMKVGGNTEISVDVRILAATNVDLRRRIEERRFRPDLFYRLNVINVWIPPLRNRTKDIIPLAEHFLRTLCRRKEKAVCFLSDEAKVRLLQYSWPGNVRELQSLCERIASISDDELISGESILHHLAPEKMASAAIAFPEEKEDPFSEFAHSKNGNRRLLLRPSADRETLIQVLEANNFNVTKSAKQLNISRRTLYRRIEEYNLMG